MRRLSLWVLLVAGIAAIAGLLLLTRSDSPAGAARHDAARGDRSMHINDNDDDGARANTGTAMAPRPRLPEPTSPALPESNPALPESDNEMPAVPASRVYVRENGTIVSDFREDAPPPTLRGRPPRPQTAGLVEPSAILAVRNAMRPIVRQCTQSLPAASLSGGARMQSHVVVRIEGGLLRVDEVTTGTLNVAESDVAGLRACVEDQVSTLALDVAGHRDISEYRLRFPFQLQR